MVMYMKRSPTRSRRCCSRWPILSTISPDSTVMSPDYVEVIESLPHDLDTLASSWGALCHWNAATRGAGYRVGQHFFGDALS
jgi:hypothetical protein